MIVRPKGAGMLVRWLSIAEHWRIASEVRRLKAVIAEHEPHTRQYSDFDSLNCRVCGRSWGSMRLAGATVRGCPERLGAWLALYQHDVEPWVLIPPNRRAKYA